MNCSADKISRGDESRTRILLWVLICFSLALTFYVQYPALINANKIQDDARQHIFYMAKFHDKELFENDYLTQAQTREFKFRGLRFIYDPKSVGFSVLYYIADFFVSPLLFNKILPFFLMIVCVVFAFKLGKRIAGNTCGSFLAFSFIVFVLTPSSLSVTQGLQRSFAFPLLFTFSYYLIEKKYIRTALTVIIGLLIYPTIASVLILAYSLTIIHELIETKSFSRIFRRGCLPLIIVVLLAILIMRSMPSVPFTAERKITDPYFGPQGNCSIFTEGALLGIPKYLISSPAGLFTESALGYYGRHIVPLVLLSFVLFTIVGLDALKIKKEIWYTILSGLCMFVLAWGLALMTKRFILLLPSRYTSTTIPFFLLLFISLNSGLAARKLLTERKALLRLFACAAIIFAAVLIAPRIIKDVVSSDGILQPTTTYVIRIARIYSGSFACALALIGTVVVLQSRLKFNRKYLQSAFLFAILGMICLSYVSGMGVAGVIEPAPDQMALYRFLSTLPKNCFIAGHPEDMANIPIFSKRRVFESSEFNVSDKRLFDLFAAYYSDSPENIRNFCTVHGIDYWVVNSLRFSEDYLSKGNIYNSPFDEFVKDKIKEHGDFVLSIIPKEKRLFEAGDLFVVASDSIR